jgi:hypothetical protein
VVMALARQITCSDTSLSADKHLPTGRAMGHIVARHELMRLACRRATISAPKGAPKAIASKRPLLRAAGTWAIMRCDRNTASAAGIQPLQDSPVDVLS